MDNIDRKLQVILYEPKTSMSYGSVVKKNFICLPSFEASAEKRLSYILVTKNRAQDLEKKLISLRDLVGPNDELIIVDGGSSDGTADLVSAYDDIIHIFISEPDINSGHAFNKGVMLARGKYVHWISDDDVTKRVGMEQAMQLMETHAEIDFLACGGRTYMVSQNRWRSFYFPPGINYGTRAEDPFILGACGTGFIIRRSSIAHIGLSPIDVVTNDKAYMAQCINQGGIVRFARIDLFDHIISEKSYSITGRKKLGEEREYLLRRYCAPSFFVKRRLKKIRFVRIVSLLWGSNLTAHFFYLAREQGLRSAMRQMPQAVHDYERKKKHHECSDPVWDGGLS